MEHSNDMLAELRAEKKRLLAERKLIDQYLWAVDTLLKRHRRDTKSNPQAFDECRFDYQKIIFIYNEIDDNTPEAIFQKWREYDPAVPKARAIKRIRNIIPQGINPNH